MILQQSVTQGPFRASDSRAAASMQSGLHSSATNFGCADRRYRHLGRVRRPKPLHPRFRPSCRREPGGVAQAWAPDAIGQSPILRLYNSTGALKYPRLSP
jgi:hypothetical protein